MAAPLPVLVVTNWSAGATPPACAVKESAVGARVSGGGATVSVMATGIGLFSASELATMTVPEYVPADSPAESAEMPMEPGVLPEPGFTRSQLPVLEEETE
jgi:hypothetical protein